MKTWELTPNDPFYTLPPPDEPGSAAVAAKRRPASSAPAKRRNGKGAATRFAALNVFLDVTTRAKSLTPGAVAVWVVLWRDTDATTGLATAAQQYIADRARVSIETVKRAVKELREKRLLTVVSRGCNRHKQLSTYRIHAE